MKILVTNDDGIDAKGIKILEQIALQMTDDVWVVAPHIERSACGHAITINDSLRLTPLKGNRYMLNGTPSDCIIVALKDLLKDNLPDLILSGINKGSNIAEDITYSGTVGAAIEGTCHKIPSIALSQVYRKKQKINWNIPLECGKKIITQIWEEREQWAEHSLINVNFPAVQSQEEIKGIKVVPHGISRLRNTVIKKLDPYDRSYYWVVSDRIRDSKHDNKDCDFEVIQDNHISITPIDLDLNNTPALKNLQERKWKIA